MRKDNRFLQIYRKLLSLYGQQGWWPIDSSYQPGNYDIPQKKSQLFEICIGAILTQNTNFKNVEQALCNLRSHDLLNPVKLIKTSDQIIQKCIQPSGYFNQKTKKILIFTHFFIQLKNHKPGRNELLELWGIGPETADSMLLYGWHEPTFVIDSYTRRVFVHLNLINPSYNYDQIKKVFEKNLPKDYQIYNEYHALIVKHAKTFYGQRPYGKDCPILSYLSKTS